MRPCSNIAHLFGHRRTLTVRQAIKAGAPIRDLLWVAGRLGLGHLCADFAARCAARCAARYARYATHADHAALHAAHATSAAHADQERAAQVADFITLFGDIT